MTPTEQDEELEKKLMDLFCKTEQFALEFFGGKTSKEEFARNNSSGKTFDRQQAAHIAMQLITADRKRVELEARIDELNSLPHRSVTALTSSVDQSVIYERIAGLKQELESYDHR